MLLRTRMRITTTSSLGAVLVLGVVLAWSFVEARKANLNDNLAGDLLRASLERGMLGDEYVMFGEARARAQWQAKSVELGELLKRAAGEFKAEEDGQVVGEMAVLLERSTALFTELLRSGDEGAVEGRLGSLAVAFRQRATSNLLLISHDMNSRSRQLATSASTRFDVTQRRTTLLLVVLLGSVFVVIFVNARMVATTLERRITLLRDGAEQVASGSLHHRISVQGDDELAELGGTFDRMTDQLEKTYASLESEVAERRRAQEDVARLNDQLHLQVAALEVSNRELEAFSYAVSHDLRAPLRSVAGFSQAVLEDYGSKLDAQGRQYLELASEAAREMGQLIDDLIGLSRVARVDIRREPVDLSELGRSVIDELRRAEPERQVEVEIAPALMVEGDPTLLRLAIENLLRNAWKFTSRHPTARISMGRTTSRGQQAFFVADDGAGFEMAYVDKLFNPFQRLHRTIEFPGTGIGLATVRRIVRRHGGEAWALGQVEQGATIYFTLPSREGSHAGQDHPAGRGQPEGRAPDRAGLQAVQDRQPAPRGP